ncbi:cellulose synthase operon protein YhjQ/BcsQ [Azotobacter sp. CWF10]
MHRDEALAEALASQESIFAFDPGSAAAHDLDTIARRLGRLLGDLEPTPPACAARDERPMPRR